MASKYIKGDMVSVISGKYKGVRGTIKQLFVREQKAIVEGVNIVKRHMKPSKMNPDGGIISMEKPISLSNLLHYCEKKQKVSRVGFKKLEDGKKVRFLKCSGEILKVNTSK